MTLDTAGLEHAIVRHCSPTLAAMKPGCLFNVPGAFVADTDEEPAARLASWRESRRLRRALDAAVGAVGLRLGSSGVRVSVIARHRCGALVYVWRPDMLALSLADARVRDQLVGWGYELDGPGWLERAVGLVGRRLEQCHRRRPEAAFPHEVGFFLGYPYDDVMGFIEHEGRDYLCCGLWKVYAERERAEERFERYKRCTRAYEALLDMGADIADLALVRIGEAA